MSEIVAIEGAVGFGCGAIVALRSGGYPMTVREAVRGSRQPTVWCDWHSNDGYPQSEKFPVAMLTRSEPLAAESE